MKRQAILSILSAAVLWGAAPSPVMASTPAGPPNTWVNFEKDSTTLRPDDLEKVEQFMAQTGSGRRCVVIVTPSGTEGSTSLQSARLSALKAVLIQHGIASDCIELRRSMDSMTPLRIFLSADPQAAWDAVATEAEKNARFVPMAARKLATALSEATGCGTGPGRNLGDIVFNCQFRGSSSTPIVSVFRVPGRADALSVTYRWSETSDSSTFDDTAARDVARAIFAFQRVTDIDGRITELFALPQENHGGSISVGGTEAVEISVRKQGNVIRRNFQAVALPSGW